MKKPNVAVVGVGAVGIEMVRMLKERKFPFSSLRLFARSQRQMNIEGENYQVEVISPQVFSNIDIALFAGTEGEKGAAVTYAPAAVKAGAVVIDNGADFRLQDNVPLIVPEVNKDKIITHRGIIANPNCTTIQMVVALGEIYRRFGLKKVVLTSFQAASGAGRGAMQELRQEALSFCQGSEEKGEFSPLMAKVDFNQEIFSRQLLFNVVPQIGSFKEEGFTTEEIKVVKETHKIFSDESIKITATCVRVPVFVSHSEAIYFSTKTSTTIEDIENALAQTAGVKFFPAAEDFPTALDAAQREEVFAGRLRRGAEESTYWIWVVADNLLKGAALNAVQIAEELLKN